MKRLMLAVLLVTGVIMMSQPAMAFTFTLSPAQIQQLYKTYATGGAGTTVYEVESLFDGAKFIGKIAKIGGGSSEIPEIWIGSTALGISDLSGFDAYALNIGNWNENTWEYCLYLNAGGSPVQSGWTAIPVGSSAGLMLNLTTVSGLNNISDIGFCIRGKVPLGTPRNPDYTFETVVAPVPEPATMLLLGPALLGLAGLKRKKSSCA